MKFRKLEFTLRRLPSWLLLLLCWLIMAGVVTLYIQRKLYQRRRRAHLGHEAREAGGLPVGSSRRSKHRADGA